MCRDSASPGERGASLEAERQAVATVELSQSEIKFEEYTGKMLQKTEVTDDRIKHIAIRHMLNAVGVELNWTINQEILFSLAIAGTPVRKPRFST